MMVLVITKPPYILITTRSNWESTNPWSQRRQFCVLPLQIVFILIHQVTNAQGSFFCKVDIYPPNKYSPPKPDSMQKESAQTNHLGLLVFNLPIRIKYWSNFEYSQTSKIQDEQLVIRSREILNKKWSVVLLNW